MSKYWSFYIWSFEVSIPTPFQVSWNKRIERKKSQKVSLWESYKINIFSRYFLSWELDPLISLRPETLLEFSYSPFSFLPFSFLIRVQTRDDEPKRYRHALRPLVVNTEDWREWRAVHSVALFAPSLHWQASASAADSW